MAKTIERLMVVEDNPAFSSAAVEYFRSVSVNPIIAKDYDDAKTFYEFGDLEGAIVDCFFPYKIGTNTISVGQQVANKMEDTLQYPKNPIGKALKQVGELLGEEFAKLAEKNSRVEYLSVVDNFWVMDLAMRRSENNQPLGILVAEELDKRRIPFVLATSTYHHDILTQPIQDYASKMGWRLIDCEPNLEDEKATRGYWLRAYNALIDVMMDQNKDEAN
jgi:hypothetical protein